MESLSNKTAGSFVGLGILLLTAAILTGCDARSHAQSETPPPPEVDVASVLAEPVTLTETFTGRVQAPETVQLRPRVSGYIHKVAFEEGELVKEGDLLFQIDPRPYQARVQAAEAELAQARSQLQLAESEASRARRLLDNRAISREEYDQRQAAELNARAQVNAAQAALETAQLDLQYTRIKAPVSGRIGRARVTRGNLASADQTLLSTLVSVNPLHVYFESNGGSALKSQSLLASNNAISVHIGLGNEEGFPHQGTLDFVSNRLNPDTGTLQYRAVLPNPEGHFKPGQFARVDMPVTRLDRALLVNRKAVLTNQDRRFVYVVNTDNTVSRQQVSAGRNIGKLVVIQSGLNPGDRVVVNGTQKIFSAGMEVQPQQVAMRPPSKPAPQTKGSEETAVAATQP